MSCANMIGRVLEYGPIGGSGLGTRGERTGDYIDWLTSD